MAAKPSAPKLIAPHGRQAGDHFEEDTLLPPPAPCLVDPMAEHVFDPPTWPGFGAPLRPLRNTARLSKTEADAGGAMAAAHAPPVLHEQPLPEGPPTQFSGDSFADPDPTPRTAIVLGSTAIQTADVLPPLPQPPRTGTAWALLSYLMRVAYSRWQRRRIALRTERSLRAEGETLDRALAEIGHYAFIEQVDLLALYPPDGEKDERALEHRSGEARPTPLRAESWAARIDAEQLRTRSLLMREEARLSSELLQCIETHRQDEAWSAEPALRDEFEVLLGRLAAVRVERWVQERARNHCQRNQAQLLTTLESLLAVRSPQAKARRLPSLLLLGSLLASQRSLSSTRAIEPWFSTVPGRPAGMQLSPVLFKPLWRFQDSLLPRAVLWARSLVERTAYDEAMLRHGLLLIGVLGMTLALVLLIVLWALSTGR